VIVAEPDTDDSVLLDENGLVDVPAAVETGHTISLCRWRSGRVGGMVSNTEREKKAADPAADPEGTREADLLGHEVRHGAGELVLSVSVLSPWRCRVLGMQ